MRCNCKKLVSTVAIVAIIGGAAAFGMYAQKQQQKHDLVMETFSPQFKQVEMLKTRINGQLKIKFAAEPTPMAEQEDLFKIVDHHIGAINKHIMDVVMTTYTADELKAKAKFEDGNYMDKLMGANQEINLAVKVFAQHLNREGTLEALKTKFEDDDKADNLREVILKLSNDTVTPDSERLDIIAEELDMPKQQATPVLILLALSKEAVLMQQNYLKHDFATATPDHIEAAKRYVKLNHLDTLLKDNKNIVADADDQDAEQIRSELELVLAAVVTRHLDLATLNELNTYFETEQAQAIMAKDITVAQEIAPKIKEMIEAMQAALQAEMDKQEQKTAADGGEANPVVDAPVVEDHQEEDVAPAAE